MKWRTTPSPTTPTRAASRNSSPVSTTTRFPPKCVSRIKLLMLDSLGCALYGADLEWSRILQDTLANIDATRTCSVWGTRQKLSAPHAALVNGTQVQGFELDDVHRAGVLHVGAVVLPALISLTELQVRHERQGIPDRRRRRLRDRPARRPVHGPRAHRLGLALGRDAGRVLRRRRRRARPETRRRQDRARAGHCRHPGRRPDGRAIRRDGQAHACRPLVAIRALWRAVRRSAASPASSTCWKANTAASARRCRSRPTSSTSTNSPPDFGETWQTMGVALKFYACVGSNHTTLDALRDDAPRAPFERRTTSRRSSSTAREVTVHHVGWKYVPQGLTSAQLNLPYCVATWLLENDVLRRPVHRGQWSPTRSAWSSRKKSKSSTTRRSPRWARSCATRCMSKSHLNDGTVMKRTVEAAPRQRKQFRLGRRHRREIREARGQGAAARRRSSSCATRCSGSKSSTTPASSRSCSRSAPD